MKLFLRIITLFCYFLPFTYFLSTCNRGPWEVTYNKQEGERILADTARGLAEVSNGNLEMDTTMVITVDTLRDSSNNFTVVRDTLKPKEKLASEESSDDKILSKFFFPTKASASAFGFIVFPDNDVSRILLGLTVIITLASLIVFIITKRRKITLALLWANLLSLIAFITSCFASDITLLYGTWIVFALLVIQIYLEYKNNRRNQSNNINSTILLLMLLTLGSWGRKTLKVKMPYKELHLPSIKVVKTTFPLYLSGIDFDAAHQVKVAQRISSKIQSVIEDFYFKTCDGDSAETYFSPKDVYYNTVEVSNDTLAAYLVLLNGAGVQTSKILLFDKRNASFYDGIFDFSINALFDFESQRLKPSNLKMMFKMKEPEMVLLRFGKDSINAIKFVRLYHNGTSNAIEIIIMNCSDPTTDTLSFKHEWIN